MIRIVNLHCELSDGEAEIEKNLRKLLKTDKINSFRIARRSIDARKKNDVHYVLTVDASVSSEEYI